MLNGIRKYLLLMLMLLFMIIVFCPRLLAVISLLFREGRGLLSWGYYSQVVRGSSIESEYNLTHYRIETKEKND